MFDLTGKCAVVTGGGRGIGRGISLALAAAGADLFVTGRSSAMLEATVAQIRAAGGRAVAMPADITDMAVPGSLAERALAEFGRLDVWVNNAGSAAREDVGALIDLNEGQWDRVVDLNMKSAFFGAQAAARAMRGRGGGSIINITSRSGSHPNPMTGQYEEADTRFMADLEARLGAEGKDAEDFRTGIMHRIAAWRMENPDAALDFGEIFADRITRLNDSFYEEKRRQADLVKRDILVVLLDGGERLEPEARQRAVDTLRRLETEHGHDRASITEAISFLLKERPTEA